MEDLQFTEVNETSRKYHFPTGTVEIQDVKRLCIRPSGGHRLECGDGSKWVINSGWLAVEIVVGHWSL